VEFLAEDCLGVVVSVRTAVSSEIHLFALPTGEPLRRLPTPSIPLGGDPLAFGTSQSFSSTSDGTFTAAVTEGSRVLRMWKTEDGSVLRDLRFAPYDPTVGLDRYRNASIPQPRVLQGDFSPGGDRLATLERTAWSGEALLKIWDVLTGEIEQKISWTASSGSNSLAWDPRGELLAVTGSRDDQDSVLFLRFSDGEVLDLLGQADPVDVTSVVLLDNETVLWAGPDSIIRQGSIATGESEIWAAVEPVLWQSPPIEDDDDDAEDYVLTDDLTQISKLSLHPGGKLLASAHGSGIVRIWDIERRAVVHELPAMLWDWDSYDPDYGEPGLDCDFSSDGRYLITGGSDCGLRLWETETGEEVQMLPLDTQDELDRWNPIAQVAALPSSDGSGTCAVISDVSRTILQVWDLSEGKKTAEVPGSQGGYGGIL
jgi:WD40 repeat protein